MYVVVANYGNDSLAAIQWLYEQSITAVTVISIDTGWGAIGWALRVERAEAFVRSKGYRAVRIVPPLQFEALIRDRAEFPDQKFQWCAGILKGLPLLEWLDEEDPGCEYKIVLATRRVMSSVLAYLPEHIPESEHFGERAVWHPLYQHTDEMCHALLQRAGWEVLPHRSLECDPCVNSGCADFRRLAPQEIEKHAALESALHKNCFYDENGKSVGIVERVTQVRQTTPEANESGTRFDMGCGAPFGCGQ